MKEFTVEVRDKALSKALQGVAFDNEWKWISGATEVKLTERATKIGFNIKEKTICNHTYRCDFDYTLPQDWDKVVALIKKSNEPEYKVGDWVYHTNTKEFFRLEERNEYKGIFVWNGMKDERFFRLAKKEEIEQALIKEAKRRGYFDHRKFKDLKDGVSGSYLNEAQVWNYNETEDALYGSIVCVYKNGEWAEIIEDKLTLAGYDVTIDPNDIQIGCRYIDKKKFSNFIDVFCDLGYDEVKNALWHKSEVQLHKQLSKIQEKL